MLLLHVQDDVAVGVHDLGEGDGLLVQALVGDGAEGRGHVQRRNARRAEGQARAVLVDHVLLNAQGLEVFHGGIDAHQVHQGVGRHDVQRGAHALAQRDHAPLGGGGEVGGIALGGSPALDGQGKVGDHRGRRVAKVQGGAVDGQGLDGRTHGHGGDPRAVQLQELGGRRPGAHDAAQLSGAVIDDGDSRLGLNGLHDGAVTVLRAHHGLGFVLQSGVVFPVVDGLLHDVLHRRVDGGVDGVAAGLDLVADDLAVGGGVVQAAQLQEGVGGVREHGLHGGGHVVQLVDRGFLHHRDGVLQGGQIFLVGDGVVFIHGAQHIVGAVVGVLLVARAVIVAPGIVAGGVSGDARQGGALPQGQLVQVLVKVVLGRGLDAIVGLAQRNGVQIPLQNLLLGGGLFQLDGHVGLLDLALVGLLGGEQAGLDQLLGDGGAALHGLVAQVGHKGADDTLDVDAVVRKEARVLHADKGHVQLLGNLLEAGPDAVFTALVIGDQVAVHIVDEAGQVLLLDLLQVQIGRGVVIALSDAQHQPKAGNAQHKADHQGDGHGLRRDGNHEVGLLGTGFEQGEVLFALVLLVFRHERLQMV